MRYSLYHSTELKNFISIEKSGFIRGATNHHNKTLLLNPYGYEKDAWGKEFKKPLYTPGVSLTRDFEFAKNWCHLKHNIIFEFDSRELKQRFRIKPINYFCDDKRARPKDRTESEEFVIGEKGIPFNDTFVKNIYVSKEMFKAYDLYIKHVGSIEELQNRMKRDEIPGSSDGYMRDIEMYDFQVERFLMNVEVLIKYKLLYLR